MLRNDYRIPLRQLNGGIGQTANFLLPQKSFIQFFNWPYSICNLRITFPFFDQFQHICMPLQSVHGVMLSMTGVNSPFSTNCFKKLTVSFFITGIGNKTLFPFESAPVRAEIHSPHSFQALLRYRLPLV